MSQHQYPIENVVIKTNFQKKLLFKHYNKGLKGY